MYLLHSKIQYACICSLVALISLTDEQMYADMYLCICYVDMQVVILHSYNLLLAYVNYFCAYVMSF